MPTSGASTSKINLRRIRFAERYLKRAYELYRLAGEVEFSDRIVGIHDDSEAVSTIMEENAEVKTRNHEREYLDKLMAALREEIERTRNLKPLPWDAARRIEAHEGKLRELQRKKLLLDQVRLIA